MQVKPLRMARLARAIGASFLLAPFFMAHAQVPVVESSASAASENTSVAQASPSSDERSTANRVNAQLFSQLQLLQEEVMRMQGMIETQQHQIEQLKKQHLDDFVGLDKRLTELSQARSNVVAPSIATAGAIAAGSVSSTNAANTSAGTTTASVVGSTTDGSTAENNQDRAAYRQAYDLIKQKKFGDAKTAFESFIINYPNSIYAGNALYWLGELYILDANYPAAQKSFQTIISKYPTHAKVAEAHYKLGKVYFDQGKKDDAKQEMEFVITNFQGKADHVVSLAKSFVEKHFP
ncbi:Cell division coordinator CpoB [BD1-7 clade bacterium]|uniref:Cell division coordinator CpoB n=1 Tax=BD1-7 clade bacterium TaxID=2029982 RepID=A0A5S9N6Q8_9GAMM|nr:Cell division coordinator CpoB [BD1-7 clade bacterium]CAA0084983.1 Cell division coordinator CpoB [BD1-7 clade bacterium]